MNGKRIAAIIGLIGLVSFLVAASISIVFVLRKKEEQTPAEDAEEKP